MTSDRRPYKVANALVQAQTRRSVCDDACSDYMPSHVRMRIPAPSSGRAADPMRRAAHGLAGSSSPTGRLRDGVSISEESQTASCGCGRPESPRCMAPLSVLPARAGGQDRRWASLPPVHTANGGAGSVYKPSRRYESLNGVARGSFNLAKKAPVSSPTFSLGCEVRLRLAGEPGLGV